MYQIHFRVVFLNVSCWITKNFFQNHYLLTQTFIPKGYNIIKYQFVLFDKGCCSLFI